MLGGIVQQDGEQRDRGRGDSSRKGGGHLACTGDLPQALQGEFILRVCMFIC